MSLLAPDRVLWAPEMTTVMLIDDGSMSRSQAKYAGYREVDFEVCVGHFYPFDWHVSRSYLRRDLRAGPEAELTHMLCSADHPEAAAYWRVEYREQPKTWRDGAWRKAA